MKGGARHHPYNQKPQRDNSRQHQSTSSSRDFSQPQHAQGQQQQMYGIPPSMLPQYPMGPQGMYFDPSVAAAQGVAGTAMIPPMLMPMSGAHPQYMYGQQAHAPYDYGSQYQQPPPIQQQQQQHNRSQGYNNSNSMSGGRGNQDRRFNNRDNRNRDNRRDRDNQRDNYQRDNQRDYNNTNSRSGGGSGEQRELHSRTLFVRNISYETPESEIREIFGSYGDIKQIFSLLEKRGLLFITYYDLRASDAARKALNGVELRGRRIDVHFSVPKNEDMNSRTCDGEKNQGTILLTQKEGKKPLDNNELKEFFSQFGDVKVVRNYKEHANQRFVEFWDSRHCKKAVETANQGPYHGGYLDLRFAWDTPHRLRQAAGNAQNNNSSSSMSDSGRGRMNQNRRYNDHHHHDRDHHQPQQPQPHYQPAVQQQWNQPMPNPLGPQAQQAQQMLAALAQMGGLPVLGQQAPGFIPPPAQTYVQPQPVVSDNNNNNNNNNDQKDENNDGQGGIETPLDQSETTPNDSNVALSGPEALAQMNQLLAMLQQTSETGNVVNEPKDPRRKSPKKAEEGSSDVENLEDTGAIANNLLDETTEA